MYSLRFRNELPAAVTKEFESFLGFFRSVFLKEHNEDGTHNVGAAPETVPVGSIQMWSGASAPSHWLICDGSQVSRVKYKSLFDVMGTTYGAGDGVLTFNLPDLRQRFPLGKAASGTGSALGATGGAIDHTHTVGSHSHSISSEGGHSHGGNTGSGGSHTHSVSGTTTNDTTTPQQRDVNLDGSFSSTPCEPHVHDFSATTSSDGSHNHSISSDGGHNHGGSTGSASGGSTGGGNPPYLVVNYIVLAGV